MQRPPSRPAFVRWNFIEDKRVTDSRVGGCMDGKMFRNLWVKINRTECVECNSLRVVFRSASWRCSRCLFDRRHRDTVRDHHFGSDAGTP